MQYLPVRLTATTAAPFLGAAVAILTLFASASSMSGGTGRVPEAEPADLTAFRAAAGDQVLPVTIELRDPRMPAAAADARPRAVLDRQAQARRAQQDHFIAALPSRGIDLLPIELEAKQADGAVAKVRMRYTQVLNGFSAYATPRAIAALRALPEVRAVHVDTPVRVQMNRAIDYTLGQHPNLADRRAAVYGANEEMAPAGSSGHPETPKTTTLDGFEGQNLVVSVIDTGVDWKHPMFGGSGHTSPNPQVPPNPPAAEDNRKVTYLVNFSVGDPGDDYGHGTFVASNAAGYRVDGTTSPRLGYGTGLDGSGVGPTPNGVVLHGTAPQATIMGYKTLSAAGAGANNSTQLALDDSVSPCVVAVDTAGCVEKPIADVINMSLGGGGSATSASSKAANNAALAGAIVVASAGNSGPGASTVGAPCMGTLVICVGASLDPGSTSATVVLAPNQIANETRAGSGPAPETGAASNANAVHPTEQRVSRLFNAAGGGPVADGSLSAHYVYADMTVAGNAPPSAATNRIVLVRGTGTFANIANSIAPLNPAAIAIIHGTQAATALTVIGGIPTFTITPADANYLIDLMLTGDAGDGDDTVHVPHGTISELPLRISDEIDLDVYAASMAGFSSRGPNSVGGSDYRNIKPDVTAPGAGILAAATPDGNPNVTGMGEPSGYIVASGTSFSGPIAAGAAALVRQRVRALGYDTTDLDDPDYRTKRHEAATIARALLQNNATNLRNGRGVPQADGSDVATVHDLGSGHIDVARALSATAIMVSPTKLLGDGVEFDVPALNPPTLDSQGNLDVLLPTHAFGPVGVAGAPGVVVKTAKVILRDIANGAGSGNYALTWQNDLRADLPGIAVDFLAANGTTPITALAVPPRGSAEFYVRIAVDGQEFNIPNSDILWYVTARQHTSGRTLRMPFYLRATPYVTSLVIAAPVQAAPTNVETPAAPPACGADTNGAYQLNFSYTLPTQGATPIGFRIQEGTQTSALFTDGPDEELVAGENAKWEGSPQWTTSINPDTGNMAYYVPDSADQDEELVMVDAVTLPASSTLAFDTFQDTETDFDFAIVELIADGTTFQLGSFSGTYFGTRSFDLSEYAGRDVRIQFRMTSDSIVSAAGWWIENIRIEADDFTTIAEAPAGATSHALTNRASSTRFYRIAALFDDGGILAGPYSNVQCVAIDLDNELPVARAGADFNVTEGSGVMLSAAGTSDAENDPLTYTWTQTGGPAVMLTNSNTASASFTAPAVDADTPLTFRLEVTQPGGGSATDEVTVTVIDVRAKMPDNNRLGGSLSAPFVLLFGAIAALRRRRAGVLALALALGAPLAHAQALPEYVLHFHGNTHEGTPSACTGNGAADVAVCGGPTLTASSTLDTAAAAHFEDNGALTNTAGTGAADPNWTWRPTQTVTVRGPLVVEFWGSCSASCVALGAVWDVSLWKNGVKVADYNDVPANPELGDVPSLLTLVLNAPQISLTSADRLTLLIKGAYTVDNANTRIYYDSTQSCGPGATGPCDSAVVFNAADNDADGVPDRVDECPGTPTGVTVDATGCPPPPVCARAATTVMPASGPPATVDLAVELEWARLAPTADYGAIVHFYAQGTKRQQDHLLRALGLRKVEDFRRYTTAVYVEGPVAAFQALVKNPWIMRVEHNAPLRLLDATQSWTTRIRMAQERVAEGPYRDKNGDILAGKGVTLGVIDGGLFGAHPDFKGRITHNFKIVNPAVGAGAPQYVDVGEGDSENVAGGHGTHVTGIVAGDGRMSNGGYPNADVAPWAPGTFTSASPQAKIINWAHGAGILIISANVAYRHLLDNLGTPGFATLRAVNNSYGETTPGTAYNPNDAGKQMIKQIVACDVNMVFAAGNSGGDGSADRTSSYCKDPTPGVICVASYNDQGTGALNAPLSSFSSRGRKGNPSEYPDIAAPGDLSTSACAQATPTQAICTGGDDNAAETEWQPWYGTISGTSMASPNITGVIGALVQANPKITAPEIEVLLQRTARKVGADYEPDPQLPGNTVHFGYGAGLVDMQRALDELALNPELGITKAGLMATETEWTIFEQDEEPDVNEGAANVRKLTMQNVNRLGPGVLYRLEVEDATDFVSPELAYRLEQNVRGVATKTTIFATPENIGVAEPSLTNNAVATFVERAGNVISFFVPYAHLGYPPINEPIHNVRVVVFNEAGAVDYAPSPAGGTVQTAAVQPMYGRAFTTRLAPGELPLSTERACALPGLTRVLSGPGTTSNDSNTGMDDLRRISLAEPADMPGKLVITMKVDNLNPAPIPGYRWYVYFNLPNRTNVESQFVALDTTGAAPAFIRGWRNTINNPAAPVGNFNVEGDLPGSTWNADGTITLVLDKAQFGIQTGMAVTGIAGSIRQTSNPQTGTGLTVDTASALEPYLVVGNLPCPVTTAVLKADRTSGNAPLVVTLDGSDSIASGDDATLVKYTFDFGDGSAPVTQATSTIAHVYDEVGFYLATLTVEDSERIVSKNEAEVLIEVAEVNLAPVADAGTGGIVTEGAAGSLNGNASSDPNGDPLTYAWVQAGSAGDPAAAIANPSLATTAFTAPSVCTDRPITFRLTVTDPAGLTHSDTVTVTVRNINNVPTASAGSDFTVDEGETPMLAATATDGNDCDELTYAWQQLAGPPVTLVNGNTDAATFDTPRVDSDTILVFQVKVTDSAGGTDTDEIQVIVRDASTAAEIGNNAVGGFTHLTLLLLALLGIGRARRR